MLERRALYYSTGEKVSFGMLLVALVGVIGRAIVRFVLFLGDSIFKSFWRRNDHFVRAAQAETFKAQMEELVELPNAVDQINHSNERQTRMLEKILSCQEEHGLDIAELRTAMSFVAPGAIRLRRRLARRSTDPRPVDPALLDALDPDQGLHFPPDQSEDVAGHDEF
jgi:hypothetical protein